MLISPSAQSQSVPVENTCINYLLKLLFSQHTGMDALAMKFQCYSILREKDDDRPISTRAETRGSDRCAS